LARPRTLIFLFGMAAIFFMLSTWLAGWYLKKLYGNHLEKLRNVLRELGAAA